MSAVGSQKRQPPAPGSAVGSVASHTQARVQAGGRDIVRTGDVRTWQSLTERTLREALDSRDVASQVRSVAHQASVTAQRDTRKNSCKVTESLRKKVVQTEALKSLLERAIAALSQEMHNLTQRRRRTVELLTAQQGPLAKAHHRLKVRGQCRPPREKIHDEVQAALLEEASDLQRAVDQMTSGKGEISTTLEQMALCKATLRNDLADKVAALELDKACLAVPAAEGPQEDAAAAQPADFVRRTLQSATAGTGLDSAADVRHIVQQSHTPPVQWKKHTERSVEHAYQLIHDSQLLRARVARYCKQALESNTHKGERTRVELVDKVKRTGTLSNSLQKRVQELADELLDCRQQRSAVAAALAAKEQPLQFCLSRLSLRNRRPTRESTRDETEVALQSQLNRLVASCRALQEEEARLMKREAEIVHLRAELERDRADKELARNIDSDLLTLDPLSEGKFVPDALPAGTPARNPALRRRPGSAPPASLHHF